MGHIYLHSGFPTHPVVHQAPDRGVVLWVRAICWMNQNERDYTIPKGVVRSLNRGLRINSRTVAHLVRLGMFEDIGDHYYVPPVILPSRLELFRFGPVNAVRPPIPAHVRALVYERDGHACRSCGATEPLSIDHIKPWSLGGAHDETNFQTLCRPCNSRKGAKWHASE